MYVFTYLIGFLRRTQERTYTHLIADQKPGWAQRKPTTIRRLLTELPKLGSTGSQHGLDLYLQRSHRDGVLHVTTRNRI